MTTKKITYSLDGQAVAVTAGRVTIGGSTTGRIETTGDHDWFAVTLTAGQSYQFRLDSTGLSDPYLRLYSSTNTLIASNDDSGGGGNSLISYTPSTGGTYYLDAAAYSTGIGTYSVSAAAVTVDDYVASTATTGGITIGGSSTGRIETIGDHDWFAVTLTAGQSYQFHLDSTGLSDPYLRLYSSTNTLIASNDDGGGKLNSLISYTPLTGGTYYLDAAAYSTGIGTYSVSAAAVTVDDYVASTATTGRITIGGSATGRIETIGGSATGRIETIGGSATGRIETIGGSATGRIETTGDHDWFAVTLTAGQGYQFRLNSTGLSDPYLRLYSSTNTLITSNDDGGGNLNSLIGYTPSTSGTYYLDAAANSTGIGTYSVSAAAVTVDDYAASTATTGRITIGGSAAGRIETIGDHDWFAVTLTAGQSYQFHLDSTGLSDPYLRLYSSANTLIASNNDGGSSLNSLIGYTALTSGTYYLDVTANSNGTGSYSISTSSNTTTATVDSSFSIKVDYTGDQQYKAYFDNAAARWAQIIVGDLPNVTDSRFGVIDDLVIRTSVTLIDGRFGVLGQASPDSFRPGSNLPYIGHMRFDSADMAYMGQNGILQDVILHEMGHVLGLGKYLWNLNGLVVNNDSYVGANALAAYRTLTNNPTLSSVPLETQGGRGTAGSHWLETRFGDELMTGYAPTPNHHAPLSIVTVGALADLGYQVNYAAADIFTL